MPFVLSSKHREDNKDRIRAEFDKGVRIRFTETISAEYFIHVPRETYEKALEELDDGRGVTTMQLYNHFKGRISINIPLIRNSRTETTDVSDVWLEDSKGKFRTERDLRFGLGQGEVRE